MGLYAALGQGGRLVPLHETGGPGPPVMLLDPVAAWQAADILAGVAPPPSAGTDRLAYKTGTSYGHRDAWAIGFDGAHVAGVWLGRADGTPLPGVLGVEAAAPLLFEAFGRLKDRPEPLAPPPPQALTVGTAELPPPLRRFRARGLPVEETAGPVIAWPPDGARVDLGLTRGEADPLLVVRLRDGRPPFAWLVDGVPLAVPGWEREAQIVPDGPGFAAIAVVDADGRAARVTLFLE